LQSNSLSLLNKLYYYINAAALHNAGKLISVST